MKVKPMQLTNRDRALLTDVQQYGLHTTKHLSAKHFPGVLTTTVLRRLRMLEAGGYLQRIPGLDTGNAWGLAKSGAKLVAPIPAKIHFPRFIQEHDLKLSALRLRVEDIGIARSWRPEHEIRAKVAARIAHGGMREQTVPDGLMGIEVKGFSEAVAVELELTQKNQTRYHRIFSDYASKKNLWGFWYVVGHPSIGTQLTTAASAFRRPEGPPYFVWSLLEEVMRDPLNARAQTRTGSFRLGEIWTPKITLPAHPPAQPMGTLAEEIEAPALELSSEYEIENTQPLPE